MLGLQYVIDLEKEILQAGLFPACIFYDPDYFDASDIAKVGATYQLHESLAALHAQQIALPFDANIIAPAPVVIYCVPKIIITITGNLNEGGVYVYRKKNGGAVVSLEIATLSSQNEGKQLREYTLTTREKTDMVVEPIFGRLLYGDAFLGLD